MFVKRGEQEFHMISRYRFSKQDPMQPSNDTKETKQPLTMRTMGASCARSFKSCASLGLMDVEFRLKMGLS